jgi:hypothetical protein
MCDPDKKTVTVTLTQFEARALMKLARKAARSRRRQDQKSGGFIPEPGKINIAIAHAEVLESGATKLEHELLRDDDDDVHKRQQTYHRS